MRNVDAGDVIREFYRIRQEKTGKLPPGGLLRRKLEAPAQRFLDACRELEIDDPLAVVRWRWDCATHAKHVISLDALAARAHLERWKAWAEGVTLEQKQADKLRREAGSQREQTIKALRILTPGMEAAKYPYLTTGRSELCLAETDLTGGFHPESRYCPTCPSAVRCAAKLYQAHGFDVVSLRAGRLHVLPKEVAAAAVR